MLSKYPNHKQTFKRASDCTEMPAAVLLIGFLDSMHKKQRKLEAESPTRLRGGKNLKFKDDNRL